MRIEETSIPDVCIKNIDKSKVDLANDVIRVIHPLLNKDYVFKLKNVKQLQKTVNENKDLLLNRKENIAKKYILQKRRKKEFILLDRIKKLVSSGLLSKDISLKNEMVILLKVVDQVPESKIDSYLNETLNIITKRGIN